MSDRPAKKPRRSPRQARSRATVEVILEATAQVLVREGAERCTTNRVAERAGVSVGSIYQYFPNKQALFVALAERHVAAVEERLVAVIEELLGAGAPPEVDDVAPMVVRAVIASEQAAPEVSRQIYRLAAQDAAVLAPVRAFERRQVERVEALASLFAGQGGLRPLVPGVAATILVRALGGVMRETLMDSPELLDDPGFRDEVRRLVDGFLRDPPEGSMSGALWTSAAHPSVQRRAASGGTEDGG